jgi:hypothetical protein
MRARIRNVQQLRQHRNRLLILKNSIAARVHEGMRMMKAWVRASCAAIDA